MKKVIFTLVISGNILALHHSGFCQNDVSQSVRATHILNRIGQPNNNFSPGDRIILMPPEHKDELIGNPYWDEHWGMSSLLLYKTDQPNEGYLTRYDIIRDEFEFNINGQVRVVQGKLVQNIVWIDSATQASRYLVNSKKYKLKGVPLDGFAEVLVEGENSLLKRMQIQVLKPNYNVALSTGSTNSRIVKREMFYYNINDDLFEIKSKKSLEPLFGKESAQMNSFIKKEKIKLNDQKDLVRLFSYFLEKRGTKDR